MTVGVEARHTGPFLPTRIDRRHRYRINVIEVAADQLPIVRDEIGAWRFEGNHNVLRTYWELPRAPSSWVPFLDGIDEIWAPNTFVADAFRAITPLPITIIPPVVDITGVAPAGHSGFGLAPDRFTFLFTFDFHSFVARKNPLAVLAAFRAAFPDPTDPVALVLKSTGSPNLAPETRAALAAAVSEDARISHLNRTMPRGEILALIRACDAYVSLHRSEGFGLGMAEAMAFARPVIATAWSGNAEFTTEDRAYPIPYQLRPVNLSEYVWAEGQVWAEPDIAAAAEAMRHVAFDRQDRERRAALGQAFVEFRYGHASVAGAVQRRLQEIRAGVVRELR